ncbi:hypothetical protein SKAU_G00265000 [Synaphobranchus kaupii]|uniref:Uncharacterized protein n=1 Tax=Synaphobranchus kaupii TaxID=118154 RepID=A0A9Q1IQ03_SYNKA|nr:hypothetical protein SKAU_G00265000 [Synaphobranchus kaupii]
MLNTIKTIQCQAGKPSPPAPSPIRAPELNEHIGSRLLQITLSRSWPIVGIPGSGVFLLSDTGPAGGKPCQKAVSSTLSTVYKHWIPPPGAGLAHTFQKRRDCRSRERRRSGWPRLNATRDFRTERPCADVVQPAPQFGVTGVERGAHLPSVLTLPPPTGPISVCHGFRQEHSPSPTTPQLAEQPMGLLVADPAACQKPRSTQEVQISSNGLDGDACTHNKGRVPVFLSGAHGKEPSE